MSPLNITIIQTSLFWEDKDANLRQFEEKITGVKNKTALVILPEMFSTGFSVTPQPLAEKMDGPTLSWMQKVSKTNNVILTGSFIVVEDGQYFNRMVWMLPNGQLGFYDKRHLFAYGGEDKSYTAGKKRLIVSANGWKINLQICYDLRFPVWARQSPQPPQTNPSLEYDLLLYVANWPKRRSLAWNTLLQARAIENQSFVVGVNRIGQDGLGNDYIGDSKIIDPQGQVVCDAKNQEGVFTYQLMEEPLLQTRSHFPFWKDKDNFHILP